METRQVKHLGYKCIGPTITPKKIERLKKAVKNDKELIHAKHLLAVLAGKKRIEVLYLLKEESELCVCDIADILSTTVSAVSHQLKVLRKNGFVITRRDAQTIYYSLSKKGEKTLKTYF